MPLAKGDPACPVHPSATPSNPASTSCSKKEAKSINIIKDFQKYRRGRGMKRTSLPNFYIRAQAAVLGMELITRDASRYHICFPTLRLITP